MKVKNKTIKTKAQFWGVLLMGAGGYLVIDAFDVIHNATMPLSLLPLVSPIIAGIYAWINTEYK